MKYPFAVEANVVAKVKIVEEGFPTPQSRTHTHALPGIME